MPDPTTIRHTFLSAPWLASAAVALSLAACDAADETPPAATAESVTATASTSAGGAAPAPSATASAKAPEYEPTDLPEADLKPKTLEEQRQAMLRRMRALDVIDEAAATKLAEIMAPSKKMGQGNPAIVQHPMTRTECLAKRQAAGVKEEKKPACGAPFMAPIYDPATQTEAQAKVCIDRYEFPGLPCEYPMTWVTTKQAQAICKTIGKRLCDAHEWEGACAGALLPPDKEYAFGRQRLSMRGLHNRDREIRWAYGPKKDHSKCGTTSRKNKGCESSGWRKCGSNSFPAGSFPECRSPFGVYDQHGNVAEHMALPMKEEQLGAKGGFGQPEMKGSWFIFSRFDAHKDDCRWRCPAWHDNEGKNHSNYHLGFRCCKDVPEP